MSLKSSTDKQFTFSQVPTANTPRSAFDRSSSHKTAFDAGLLIPIKIDELLPGDTITCRMHTYARLATLAFPILDNMYIDSWFFAVPTRILWENWERMHGSQDNPGDSTSFTVPIVQANGTGIAFDSIYDYAGIPTWSPNIEFNALPFRGYLSIYNHWFRPQTLIDSIPIPNGDGPDVETDYMLLRRTKRHDYFTSCLPEPQRGPAITLPLGTSAPVVPTGSGLVHVDIGGDTQVGIESFATTANLSLDQTVATTTAGVWSTPTNLEVDLTGATASPVNDIRMAFQLQKIGERDSRSGTRYVEHLKAHWNVTSPDFRHQRPEFLGGGTQRINATPVANMSSNAADPNTPNQGDLAAYAVSQGSNHACHYSATEHCYFYILVSLRADLNYQTGLHKMWSRSTRFDFALPALMHIGEQAVLGKEIYSNGAPTDDDAFGYIPRYDEYRYGQNLVTGRMRSNHPTSLDVWHLAQDFGATPPLLNQAFIEEDPPIDRVITVPSEPHLLWDSVFDIRHVRVMPTFGVPGMIDHF